MTTNTDITTMNQQTPTERSGPPRIVPLVGDEPAMREWADELVERARHDGVELTGDDAVTNVGVALGQQSQHLSNTTSRAATGCWVRR